MIRPMMTLTTAAILAATSVQGQELSKWGDAGDNPYFGYLARADHIIVTGDSVSMCSEACATPKPVYIFAPKALIGDKHARLHDGLYAKGYARPLQALKTLDDWTHARLNAAVDVADAIKKHLED